MSLMSRRITEYTVPRVTRTTGAYTVLAVPLLREAGHRRDHALPQHRGALHTQADRAGRDLRRPGRDRHREHAAVRGGAGAHARAAEQSPAPDRTTEVLTSSAARRIDEAVSRHDCAFRAQRSCATPTLRRGPLSTGRQLRAGRRHMDSTRGAACINCGAIHSLARSRGRPCHPQRAPRADHRCATRSGYTRSWHSSV